MSNPIDLEKTNKPIHVYLFDCTSQHGDSIEHILLYIYKDTYTNGSDTSSDNLLGLYHK